MYTVTINTPYSRNCFKYTSLRRAINKAYAVCDGWRFACQVGLMDSCVTHKAGRAIRRVDTVTSFIYATAKIGHKYVYTVTIKQENKNHEK